ncbi:Os03g0826100 [Oryza sativa Japonica Group]|uniref:Os03g0826100 protein n=1 Tax=Oryza sativa subsp. japonica TaxID=39947 RepID=A0A0P0W5W9_ORYSJ|nr:hypothetical protein EE612_021410 [Oryza sativa]BAS87156.1 Os03g0826100 [Oryza sativa Japonica Group]
MTSSKRSPCNILAICHPTMLMPSPNSSHSGSRILSSGCATASSSCCLTIVCHTTSTGPSGPQTGQQFLLNFAHGCVSMHGARISERTEFARSNRSLLCGLGHVATLLYFPSSLSKT